MRMHQHSLALGLHYRAALKRFQLVALRLPRERVALPFRLSRHTRDQRRSSVCTTHEHVPSNCAEMSTTADPTPDPSDIVISSLKNGTARRAAYIVPSNPPGRLHSSHRSPRHRSRRLVHEPRHARTDLFLVIFALLVLVSNPLRRTRQRGATFARSAEMGRDVRARVRVGRAGAREPTRDHPRGELGRDERGETDVGRIDRFVCRDLAGVEITCQARDRTMARPSAAERQSHHALDFDV